MRAKQPQNNNPFYIGVSKLSEVTKLTPQDRRALLNKVMQVIQSAYFEYIDGYGFKKGHDTDCKGQLINAYTRLLDGYNAGSKILLSDFSQAPRNANIDFYPPLMTVNPSKKELGARQLIAKIVWLSPFFNMRARKLWADPYPVLDVVNSMELPDMIY
jgi:hypothetical protein